MAHASPEDPRSIVTPDAFQVSRELLGLPLAAPSRRLVAILVDLLLIAILSQLGGTALAVSGAVFFFLLARRERSSRPTWGGRMLMGCLGIVLVVVTLSAIGAVVAFFRGTEVDLVRSEDGVEGPAAPTETGSALLLAQGVGDVILLTQSTNAEEALDPARGLVTRGRALGLSDQEIGEIMGDVVPQQEWRDEVIRAVLGGEGATSAATGSTADANPETPPSTPGEAPPEPSDERSPASDPSAVAARWAALLASGDTLGEAGEEWRGLRGQVLALSGADSLAVLEGRVDRLEERNEQLSTRVGSLRDELEAEREQEEGFFLPFLTGIFEDLGLAFGFGTIYLTIFTAWWRGQTPGKRLLGVRVLRLDGKPIGWWDAFERAGGYAAGFATGLLGFAQVFWDPNRQAIHDRVSSTVVVRDGAPRAPGRWTRAVDADPGRGVRYEFERREGP